MKNAQTAIRMNTEQGADLISMTLMEREESDLEKVKILLKTLTTHNFWLDLRKVSYPYSVLILTSKNSSREHREHYKQQASQDWIWEYIKVWYRKVTEERA